MYNYAISKLYPNYDQAIMTIFYTRDGGPFSMCFDKEDQDKADQELEDEGENIPASQYVGEPVKTIPKSKHSDVKEIERETYHDVKAVEYFIKNKFKELDFKLEKRYLDLEMCRKI